MADQLVVIENTPDKKILHASEVSREVLRIHGTWPFDFYPDELIIEEKRIMIKQKMFPFLVTTTTLAISEISNFELTNGLLFSSIHVRGGTFNVVDIAISWLEPRIAQKAKELVDGLMLKKAESVTILEKTGSKRTEVLQAMGEIQE